MIIIACSPGQRESMCFEELDPVGLEARVGCTSLSDILRDEVNHSLMVLESCVSAKLS